MNVYTNDLVGRSASHLLHEPELWDKLVTVRLARDQTMVCICLASPTNAVPVGSVSALPAHSWPSAIPFSGSNFDPSTNSAALPVESNGSGMEGPAIIGGNFGGPTCLMMRVADGDGLPVQASRLIFEYAEFHPTGHGEKRICPRCHASASVQGSTCLVCRNNVNQCYRCRSINLSNEDVFLCSTCGSSRSGKIEFSVTARLVIIQSVLRLYVYIYVSLLDFILDCMV
ncbi:unnamed protein product [Protopolystoma xenopodis]|uniref:Uncharacterized protein n=1 Tax=Protopolystoma xenopodis TaxID=117903 RepID=A0A3S5FDU7_9PLAT|nr:unnamed protein product [Protopolystoma xenopodis]